MNERTLLWTVTDPRGFNVSLASDVWEHIIAEHSYMVSYFEAIRQTIIAPDEIYFDPISTRKRKTGAQVYAYYKSHILSGLFQDNLAFVSVKFVQASAEVHGYVQTALAPNVVQSRMELIWKK